MIRIEIVIESLLLQAFIRKRLATQLIICLGSPAMEE